MACEKCRGVKETTDLSTPYVVRICSQCGHEMNVREPVKYGEGLRVEQGDRFVIPEGFIRVSADPLRFAGSLTLAGINWLAKQLFIGKQIADSNEVSMHLQEMEDDLDQYVMQRAEFEGVDMNTQAGAEQAFDVLKEDEQSSELYAFIASGLYRRVREGISKGEVEDLIRDITVAERLRAMVVFKSGFENAVWMGQSLNQVTRAVDAWNQNRDSSDEGYWQEFFKNNSYVLSTAFARPVVYIHDQAYVGGMKVDRTSAKFTDFLLTHSGSHDSVIVEIKTPCSRLVGRTRYRRGVYPLDRELSGAVAQCLDYRRRLMETAPTLQSPDGTKVAAIRPRCIVIAGNTDSLAEDQRESFELMRSEFRDAEIIAFNELFEKTASLARLFGLSVAET